MVNSVDVRNDFPFLALHKDIIYMDNACMSLRPQVVLAAMEKYYVELSACSGRSNHRLARKVEEEVDTARIKVQRLIGARDKREVVFVRNTSEALNLVAHSLNLKAGDVVLTSDKEHNSNLVPWLKLRDKAGVVYQVVPSLEDGTFDLEALEKLLTKKVKLVSLVHTSNVDGVSFPVKEVAALAHRVGAKVMVDAAQSVPHQRIDARDLDVDFLAFSAHKMMGPSGMGVLYGKLEALEALEAFMVGGDTVEYTRYDEFKLLPVPEKFEAGLQNYAGMMGTGAAAEYLMQLDPDVIHEHEVKLNRMITAGIEDIPKLHILGPKAAKEKGGIVSFYIEGKDPHQISLMLDESAGIMVRSGQHCVHSWFHARGISGSVRASLYAYNTIEEAEKLVEQIQLVSEII